MMSSPDDTTRDDTAQYDPTPGTVAGPFVPYAKIAVPQLPAGFVVRPALRADLDAADPADVALVCAPAGYGKTLLLADWARSSTARRRGLGGAGPRRQRPEAAVGVGGRRRRRLPVRAGGQPPARPVGLAAWPAHRSSSPSSGSPCSGCPGRSG